ncbi:MAG: nucleoside hydrolase [Thermoguttaceae bacterium]|nr:nucleoside hydrolase [Thermoguttaceae bacterium]
MTTFRVLKCATILAILAASFVSAALALDGDLLDVRDSADAPIPVIFDTDIGGDIDDAFALALFHNFESRGVCKLLGVTTTDVNPAVSGYVAAFNAHYGRPEIPVGVGVGRKDDSYLSGITSQKNASGALEYPIPEGFKAREAVPLLRELLAAAADRSVVIVQVGSCSNLAALLDSPGDAASPLVGRDLVEKKVRLVSVMGGAFAIDESAADYAKHREWNIICDIPAAQKLVREWPTEIVFSGYEIGDRIRMNPVNLKNDYSGRSKILHDSFGYWTAKNTKEGFDHRRPTWDLTAVLFVMRPESGRGYYTLSEPGDVEFDDDGVTRFTPNPEGKRRCYLQDEAARVRVGEAFVNLCSEP